MWSSGKPTAIEPQSIGARSTERLCGVLDYEVEFRGRVSEAVQGAFDDCVVDSDAGITTVRCSSTQLGDVLDRVQSFALVVLEIRRVPGTDVQR